MKNPEQFYMSLAYEISNASYAKRKKVGAVIVKDDNIIAFGYNGTPKGFSNVCETEDGKHTKPEVLHAESNAITKCARIGGKTQDSTLYVTTGPCVECAKLIIQAGIRDVYYLDEYHDPAGIELLKKALIRVHKIKSL